jgi:pyruvate ferredoxin oxidoreductase gamma subunit
VDATKIAIEEIGIPAINTCILGAFAATTNWIQLQTLQSILNDYFKGKILDRNLRSAERGYNETQVIEYS